MEEHILELIKQQNPSNPLQYVRTLVKDYSVDKLCEQIISCKDCSISNQCGKTLPHGNTNATIMIIGSSPEVELVNQTLSLYDGESNVILDKVIDDIIGINREELFFANVLNCWPYKQAGPNKIVRVPTKQELDNCYLFINHLIEIVQPLAIILFGSSALNAFEPTKAITKDRGEWFSIKGIPTIATFSPDYFLKITGVKDEELVDMQKYDFISDIQKVVNYIKNNYEHISICKE